MMFGFNPNKKGYGSGRGVPGFNNRKMGTIARGDFDGDRKLNMFDCQPFNWKRQDNPKCKKCGSKNTYIQDDSFDYGPGHHGSGGTQTIKYVVCNDCGYEDEDAYEE